MSAIRGVNGVTFNAYGTKDLFSNMHGMNTDSVINYINEKDPIGNVNASNNIGKNYVIKNNGYIWRAHNLENFDSLGNRKQKNHKEMENNNWKIIRNEARKIYNKLKQKDNYRSENNNRLVTPQNTTENGTQDNVLKGSVEYDYYLPEYRNNDKQNSDDSTPCVGSYEVSGYTRSDGKFRRAIKDLI